MWGCGVQSRTQEGAQARQSKNYGRQGNTTFFLILFSTLKVNFKIYFNSGRPNSTGNLLSISSVEVNFNSTDFVVHNIQAKFGLTLVDEFTPKYSKVGPLFWPC